MEIKCSQTSRKIFLTATAFLFVHVINSLAFASHETDTINKFIKQKKSPVVSCRDLGFKTAATGEEETPWRPDS
jgi:hypothetical protein